jgi:undecaprenyl-diphosphatase
MIVVLAVLAPAAAVAAVATVITVRWPRREIASPHAKVKKVARWLIRHPRTLDWVERHLDARAAAGLALTGMIVIATAGFAVVGGLLALLKTGSTLARIDESLARWGADNATDAAAEILRLITKFGGTEYVSVAAVALGAWEVVRRRGWSVLGYLASVIGGVTIILNVVKVVVDRERPAIRPLAHFAAASFPSGHSATAAAAFAAFAVVVGRHRSRTVKAGVAGTATLVAFAVAGSRIFLGVHWLSDVLSGVAMGWAWFALCTVAFGGRLLRLGAPIEAAERVDAMHDRTPSSATVS